WGSSPAVGELSPGNDTGASERGVSVQSETSAVNTEEVVISDDEETLIYGAEAVASAQMPGWSRFDYSVVPGYELQSYALIDEEAEYDIIPRSE
ncbi:MAG: hypothetical protein NC078_08805, partial [Ruminococcus sp.]|nr:hypothetical protein [Ruminococcus sp.]